MTDDAAFLAAIRASPNDAVLRLVYADWLDEQGDTRGRFVRLEVEAVRCGHADPVGVVIHGHLRAAADTLDLSWLAAVCRVPLWDAPDELYISEPAPPVLRSSFAVTPEELGRVRHEEHLIRQRGNSWWVSSYLVLLASAILFITWLLMFHFDNARRHRAGSRPAAAPGFGAFSGWIGRPGEVRLGV